MKALLLKNWLTLRKGNPLFLAFLILYSIIGAFTSNPVFYGCFIALLCALMPKTVMAFDERSGWERYSAALPLSRKKQVGAIYVLSLLTSLAGTALFCGLRAVLMLDPGRFPESIPMPLLIAMMLITSLLMCAFNYPFIFKLGVEKGRTSMMIAAVFAVLLGILAFGALEMHATFAIPPFAYILALLASLLIWLASMCISIRLYESRDL